MPISLNPEAPLFNALRKNPPTWWNNLLKDKNTWVDIRKNNRINVYINGGSVMKLHYHRSGEFKAKIHYEYIPIIAENNYVEFDISENEIKFNSDQFRIIDLNNFAPESLDAIKKRICHFYPETSEKGIQASFVLKNNRFIDTEFACYGNRIDLIWLDTRDKKIVFVELKTIGDPRLYPDSNQNTEILNQMVRYSDFVKKNSKDLLIFYKNLITVKKSLDILGLSEKEIGSLDDYTVETKPILLIGDCTQNWIDTNASRINELISNVALGAFYHGNQTRTFIIPQTTTRNKFIF